MAIGIFRMDCCKAIVSGSKVLTGREVGSLELVSANFQLETAAKFIAITSPLHSVMIGSVFFRTILLFASESISLVRMAGH